MKGGELLNIKKPEREIVSLNKWRARRSGNVKIKSSHVVAAVFAAITIYMLLLAAGM